MKRFHVHALLDDLGASVAEKAKSAAASACCAPPSIAEVVDVPARASCC